MNDQHLLYRVEDGVGTITINREQQRNAITPEAIDLFHLYLDQAQKDEGVRALLVTGAGEKAFCTGAQLGGGMATEGKDVFGYYASLLNRLASFPKPTVARIKGFCLAGGMGFMLACDIVIAADDAKFGTPEVNVGLWPMMIGALIFRNVLQKKAMEMILLGEGMTAAEALAMGLITRVVPAANLDGEVANVLKSLVSKSPIGMRIGKDAFYGAANMPLKEALDYLSEKLKDVVSTEDSREGITAFIEKRPPVFTGR
ncbi:MAG TPA: enoyl-CoA hydratase-related protein [Syntrophales bacterium]|nr:enoyl-CoA hydratase-related protein [Syntrophales bacterium]HPJ95747.1 enoyl-CoA hydratase-related protein [Syntrophales bacterium]